MPDQTMKGLHDPNYGGMAAQMLQLAGGRRQLPGSATGRDPGQPPYQGLDRSIAPQQVSPGMPGLEREPTINPYMPMLQGPPPKPPAFYRTNTPGQMRMEPSWAPPSQLPRL
jgi:hypothetical protein